MAGEAIEADEAAFARWQAQSDYLEEQISALFETAGRPIGGEFLLGRCVQLTK